jgi:hypothetical protein
MGRTSSLWLVALLALGPGCTLVHDAASLTAFKVRESIEDRREAARNRSWAEQAWEEVRAGSPDAVYSEDFGRGFQDGFAHYLFRGGNGEPPPLPPGHYRQLRYQTPQGYRAIEDWFAGFRHGADAARRSGYRRWVTGPSSLATASLVPLPQVPGADEAAATPAPPVEGAPPVEALPPPTPAAPEAPGGPAPVPPRPQVFNLDVRMRLDPPSWLASRLAIP